MAPAASCPSRRMSTSDSDSDIEPNSSGARVFWGNLKTPEKSRQHFVNPPQTVVRTSHPVSERKSPRLSILKERENTFVRLSDSHNEGKSVIPLIENTDHVVCKGLEQHQIDSVSSVHEPLTDPLLPNTSVSSSSSTLFDHTQVNRAECSNPHFFSSTAVVDLLNAETETVIELQQPFEEISSMPEPKSFGTNGFRDSISFDTPSLTKDVGATHIDNMDTQRSPSPSSRSVSSASSHMTVDNMLFSEPSISNVQAITNVLLSGIRDTDTTSTVGSSKVFSLTEYFEPSTPNSKSETENTHQYGGFDEHGSGMDSGVDEVTPKPVSVKAQGAISSTIIDTRSTERHLPTIEKERREERVLPLGIRATSPTRVLNCQDDMDETDRLTRKERRTRARRDAEQDRQQLLSLSPSSADIVERLASPIRNSPSRLRDLIALDETHFQTVPENNVRHSPISDAVSPSKSPARIRIGTSPQRGFVGPIRSIPSVSLPLQDYTRTPARRIQVSTPLGKPLALDDPNRIPARRIPIAPSPSRLNDSVVITLPKFNVNRPPIVKSILPASEHRLKLFSSDSPSKTYTVPTRPIPKEITKNSLSNLTSPSKIWNPPSRLPIPSTSLRHVSSPTPSSNSRGPNRRPPSSANLLPSRIPSPVKQQPCGQESSKVSVPSVPFLKAAPVPHARTITNSNLRKRPRTSSDSESEEPPLKRPAITVHRKDMFSGGKSLQKDHLPSSTSQANDPPISSTAFSSGRVVGLSPTLKDTTQQLETFNVISKPLSSPTHSGTNTPILDDVAPSGTTTEQNNHLAPPKTQPELRRTGRVRRPPTPDVLFASNVTTPPATSSTSKRIYARVSRQETTSKVPPKGLAKLNDGFPVSPKRLRTVTVNNTTRNQTSIANLERAIIRKAGPRPPSPTTRVRNREKSKETLSKEREERAERRRRRSDGDNTHDSDIEYADRCSSPLLRPPPHSRAAGDSDDYETPDRPSKPSRWDPTRLAKIVKWNRTLFETIIISEDETGEEPVSVQRSQQKAENRQKSCLFRDGISTELDACGNAIDAAEPVPNLQQERIIVTKFVYDDDPVELPRTTRKRKS